MFLSIQNRSELQLSGYFLIHPGAARYGAYLAPLIGYTEKKASSLEETLARALPESAGPETVAQALYIPRINETPIQAAQRRVYEELGIHVSLQPIGSFLCREDLEDGLVEHEFDHLFRGVIGNEKINFNTKEVSEVRFFSVKEIETLLAKRTDFFAPWFRHIFHKISPSH